MTRMTRLAQAGRHLVDAMVMDGLPTHRAVALVATFMKEIEPAPKRRAAVQSVKVDEVIERYIALYRAEVGEDPVFSYPESVNIFRRLVRAHGIPVVKERLALYIQRRHTYWREKGFPLWLFLRAWNELATMTQTRLSTVPDADQTQEYLRRLQDFITDNK